MKSNRERWLRYLQLIISEPAIATFKKPYDLKTMLIDAQKANFFSRKPRVGARICIRLRDLVFFTHDGREYAALLFASSDAHGIDTTYENPRENITEHHEKKIGFGNRTEAHMVIDLAEHAVGGTQTYYAVVEESQHLGGSVLLSILRNCLKKVAPRYGKSPAGDDVKWDPSIDLHAFSSHDLISELSSGFVEDLTIVQPIVVHKGMDEPSGLYFKEKRLRIGFTSTTTAIGQLLSDVLALAKTEDCSELQIRYEPAGGKSQTVKLPTAADLADQLVSKSTQLKLLEPLNLNRPGSTRRLSASL